MFNIYESMIDGNGYLVETVVAGTKEEALNIYYAKNGIPENAKWLYYAIEKNKDEENRRILKEAGCASWEEYESAMYPSKPIEL